ncbi:MAG: YkgJ family cysteine cluster protein [Putridiphycobacter sp.]|nr:YkgJ family cysteine cluster protein [Putridiphycobacter sp.]
MKSTKVKLSDSLPLTCSRKGTCCFGNRVMLNPWELKQLASANNISLGEFRDRHTKFGGIQLKFNGKIGWADKPACSQYIEDFGCSVHEGRPLACRLFPLGRQLQSGKANYIYQGNQFPCIEGGCSEVIDLPKLTVKEYLNGQATDQFEQAQDAYLEMMQNIADIAFELLLETGLAESGDKKTISKWRKMATESPTKIVERIGEEWMEALILPNIENSISDSLTFVQKHNDLLSMKIQKDMGGLKSLDDYHYASVLMMAMALHLANSIGANPEALANHWCDLAIGFGAME